MSTADIVPMKVCQFQKDRDEQAQYVLLSRHSNEMSTAHILAMQVRQFQKHRDEQAWCEFTCVLSMNARIAIVGVVNSRKRCALYTSTRAARMEVYSSVAYR